MVVDSNTSNDPGGDVVFGYISDFTNSGSPFQTGTPGNYNAVRVTMNKNSSSNGEVPYFFARIFGLTGQVLRTEATAAIVRDIKGFQAPADGSNLDILPFALDLDTWNKLVNNNGTDNYKWNSETKQVESGSDGKVEGKPVSARNRLARQPRHRRHRRQQQQHVRYRPADCGRHFACRICPLMGKPTWNSTRMASSI